jgi:hypothetical protein
VDEIKLKNLKGECLAFKGVKNLDFNETAFQKEDSDTCGLFTIYFVFERMHNFDLSYEEILEDIFDKSCEINEETVKDFCDTVIQ